MMMAFSPPSSFPLPVVLKKEKFCFLILPRMNQPGFRHCSLKLLQRRRCREGENDPGKEEQESTLSSSRELHFNSSLLPYKEDEDSEPLLPEILDLKRQDSVQGSLASSNSLADPQQQQGSGFFDHYIEANRKEYIELMRGLYPDGNPPGSEPLS